MTTETTNRPRDIEAIGLPREYLVRLHRQGRLSRPGRGIYTLPDANVTDAIFTLKWRSVFRKLLFACFQLSPSTRSRHRALLPSGLPSARGQEDPPSHHPHFGSSAFLDHH